MNPRAAPGPRPAQCQSLAAPAGPVAPAVPTRVSYVARLADRFYSVCLPASGQPARPRSAQAGKKSSQGLTLLEMTLVLVLSGLLLAMGLRGYSALDSAKGEQLVLQVRQLETLARQHIRSTQRWPGDCNGNGLIDAPLSDLAAPNLGLADKDRAERTALFDLGTTVAAPASLAGGGGSLSAVAGNACPTQLTSQSILLSSGQADFNVPLNDLKLAGLISAAATNRTSATHAGGDFMTLVQVGLGASPTDDTRFNAIVVFNVQLKLARRLAVAVDGFDSDAYKGRVRRLNSTGNAFETSWAAADDTADTSTNVAYFFDQLPLAKTY